MNLFRKLFTKSKKPAAISVDEVINFAPEHELYTAGQYIIALGGRKNILKADNCTTRMRFEVADDKVIDETAIKKLGAKGVIKSGPGKIQVIIGYDVELITDKVKKVLGI